MSEVKTISDRLTERADKTLHRILENSFGSLGGGINAGDDFYLKSPPVIRVAIDKQFIVRTPSTEEGSDKLIAEIEVTQDEFGKLLIPITPYFLKVNVIDAYKEHNKKEYTEHEHKSFLKKIEDLDYFAKNGHDNYEF